MLYIGEEWNSSKSHHVVQEKLIIQRVKFFGIVSSMHGCFWGLFKLCMKRNWMCVFCQHTVDVYCSIENLNTFSQPQKKYTYIRTTKFIIQRHHISLFSQSSQQILGFQHGNRYLTPNLQYFTTQIFFFSFFPFPLT